jgi:hypothetical protein
LLLTADDIALLTTADGRRLRLSELPSGVHEAEGHCAGRRKRKEHIAHD